MDAPGDALGPEDVVAELDKITGETSSGMIERYLSVRSACQTPYDWPDWDPCRWEVSRCIIFGLHQAAMTLTCHFLERLLKYALIYQHTIRKNQGTPPKTGGSALAEVQEWTSEGKRLYGNKGLAANIDHACSTGLITKEQKKQLHKFREIFRNAYGHADPDKTFQDIKVEAHAVRLDERGSLVDDSTGEPRLADLMFAHGFFQPQVAEANATPYFLYIDDLARHIVRKLETTTVPDTH